MVGSSRTHEGIFIIRFCKQVVQFISEVKAELMKVAWPTKEETISSTWVVITAVALVAVWIFIADKASAIVMMTLQRVF